MVFAPSIRIVATDATPKLIPYMNTSLTNDQSEIEKLWEIAQTNFIVN